MRTILLATALAVTANTVIAAPKLTLEVRAMDWIYSQSCKATEPVAIMTYLQKHPGTPLARAIMRVNDKQIVPIGLTAWCEDMAANY